MERRLSVQVIGYWIFILGGLASFYWTTFIRLEDLKFYGEELAIKPNLLAIGNINHQFWYIISSITAIGSYILLFYSSPGYITETSYKQSWWISYEIQNVLYPPIPCDKCFLSIPRPPRSTHCRLCKKCIARFDHHCPWINSCIGQKNLRYYLLFLLFTVLLSCYSMILSIFSCYTMFQLNELLSQDIIHENIRISILRLFGYVFIVIYAIVLITLLGSLFIYAFWNIIINETTFEILKRSFLLKNKSATKDELYNPYNNNNIKDNILEALLPELVE